MAALPEPLHPGLLLADRFEIKRVLGQGGFGIAYLAHDRTRGEDVVVKELAPEGAVRTADGLLDMDGLGGAVAQRLRRCFLDEAKLLAKLSLDGIANVRTYGVEAGTAYYVTEYFADAEPLDRVIARSGRMNCDAVLDIGFQLMDTLEAVHARGVLHRDVKPANVLLRPNGNALLIDFGSAREWHADMTEHQTVLFTPGYAPLEQLSEHGKRGPATDIYGLCALLYTLLIGSAPPPSTDRLQGVKLTSINAIRPDIDPLAANATEAGLALHYAERPQTISALRELFGNEEHAEQASDLDSMDARLVALRRLVFGKRECPSCGGVLHTPKALPKGRCPVCNRGSIVARPIAVGRCPACRGSVLRLRSNLDPPVICPLCSLGVLEASRVKFLSKDWAYDCPECEAHFIQVGAEVKLDRGGKNADLVGTTHTWAEWTAGSTRAAEVEICEGCHAQFDVEADGQWRQVVPKPAVRAHSRLYPEEWARVAGGLEPGCGTHVCSTCEADYFVDGERVTLLGAFEDSFGFAEANVGRPLTMEAIRWLGAGKFSQHPGSTCVQCHTEFDEEGEYLRLVRTKHPALHRFIDTLQTFEDWHRIARGLPRVDEEEAFENSFGAAILDAYVAGKLCFDGEGTFWRGPALRIGDDAAGTLVVNPHEISFGGRLRRDKTPMEVVVGVEAADGIVSMRMRGVAEPVEFELDEIDLPVHLASGDRVLELDAMDFAARVSAILSPDIAPSWQT